MKQQKILFLLLSFYSTTLFCADLFDACEEGNYEKVKQFIASNSSVNFRDQFENTPLHYAALNGHKDIVELLLQARSKINIKNEYGWTPLTVAVLVPHKDIVELLFAHNADVNFMHENGITLLHYACVQGNEDIIELLVASGARIAEKMKSDLSPEKLKVAEQIQQGIKKKALNSYWKKQYGGSIQPRCPFSRKQQPL